MQWDERAEATDNAIEEEHVKSTNRVLNILCWCFSGIVATYAILLIVSHVLLHFAYFDWQQQEWSLENTSEISYSVQKILHTNDWQKPPEFDEPEHTQSVLLWVVWGKLYEVKQSEQQMHDYEQQNTEWLMRSTEDYLAAQHK